jgi:nucleotide-binding universal stress UspA family protein
MGEREASHELSIPTYSFTGLTPPALGDTIEALVEDVKERLRTLADVEGHAVYGLPGEALAEFSGNVNLLVVGSRNYGPLRRLVVGSTSDYLERHARCSLLALPRLAGAQKANR